MKFSESWLREWVKTSLDRNQLSAAITMAGLEVESVSYVADKFTGVVVGEVISVAKHPEAERLNICAVNAGTGKTLTIVCGASNVKAGMKYPAALANAILANNVLIKNTKLRGVESEGMLCSAQELGLGEDAEGLLELPVDAPVGKDIWEYLKLQDHLIDVSITPNRGDCLGMRGLARDVSAITRGQYNDLKIPAVKPAIKDVLPIKISDRESCPNYTGRIIKNVKANTPTPIWLREHLRRFGIRSISVVVDITNYVMLELGQPMHAFDFDKISGGIHVRLSEQGEKIALLDGSEATLDDKTLVIADDKHPIAMGGVMGGMDTCVTLETKNIFFESVFFKIAPVARACRHYHLNSDSAYRYERGVDPTYQRAALERATQLVCEIAGGEPGPISEVSYAELLPPAVTIPLRSERIKTLLGCDVTVGEVESIFEYLGFQNLKTKDGWEVTVPPRRSDVLIEVDLIEEIGRLYGFDKIPMHHFASTLQISTSAETKVPLRRFRDALCHLGYQEVVTYSFIDPKLQALFDPKATPKPLMNPMSVDMSVMRTSLWPGLIGALLYNLNRQQSRVRIFESGLHFVETPNGLTQETVLSGLVTGSAEPEQWGTKSRMVDFFDLKGDLENLFKLTHDQKQFKFMPATDPALHPGQTAQILRKGRLVGTIGSLHPSLMRALKIDAKVILFELFLNELERLDPLKMTEISKFPEIRRDLAILIDQSVPAQALQYTIREVAGDLLKEVDIFDLYQGKGIEPGRKSIALALTLQHGSRTLIDDEVAEVMNKVIVALNSQFNAELRG
jgi:phenylalanyl-tRNA synthetase beta chain